MSTLTISAASYQHHRVMSKPFAYQIPPTGLASAGDRRMSSANEHATGATTIVMRRLPKNLSPEAVRAMLLFAKDLAETEIVGGDSESDAGYSTVIARFSTLSGAIEAQSLLDGKPNGVDQTNMVVEIIDGPGVTSLSRRNTVDHSTSRSNMHATSPPLVAPTAQSSARFNGIFQPFDKSPPVLGSPPIPEHGSDTSSNLQKIFSPQSPINNVAGDRSRVSGKSVIDQDVADDDTGELLKDPVAYMKNDISVPTGPTRRLTNPQPPLSRFANLSLNTQTMTSPPPSQYTSPRSSMHSHGSMPPISPTGYHVPQHQFLRHNYPPVNPADQNPPCNTLYVGNLPIGTPEDELKALFSKQRGYKRLCFRTKQNGPMCFVEFEDVSFATKALNELYGVQLHNSVKGGIRLSFSKNPLGVRSGQPGSNNPPTPLSAAGPISLNGYSAMSPNGFSTAAGPPPGLTMPPGLNMQMPVGLAGVSGPMSPTMMSPQFSGPGLGIGIHHMRGPPVSGPSYQDYMGR